MIVELCIFGPGFETNPHHLARVKALSIGGRYVAFPGSSEESHITEKKPDIYKRTLDTLTLVVIIVGLLFCTWDQAKEFNASQNLSNWSDVSARTFEIDKVLVENPDYRKYFMEGADISPDNPDYQRAAANRGINSRHHRIVLLRCSAITRD